MSKKYQTISIIELNDGQVFEIDKKFSDYDWDNGFYFNSEQIMADSFVEINLGERDTIHVRPSDVHFIRNKTNVIEKATETDKE